MIRILEEIKNKQANLDTILKLKEEFNNLKNYDEFQLFKNKIKEFNNIDCTYSEHGDYKNEQLKIRAKFIITSLTEISNIEFTDE